MSVPKPISPLNEVRDTAELIGSFLKASDLGNLSQVSKKTQIMFSKQLAEKELLKAVFDADPKRVKEILAKPCLPRNKCIVLVRNHIKETYYSEKKGKLCCKREWNHISPLEAAAWCGDIFMVEGLLSCVPDCLLLEAAEQLKGILNRKESEEHGEFLAPFRKLILHYENFLDELEELENTQDEYYKQKRLTRLWEIVWQKQRLLPTYGLQEYCNGKPFYPLPAFETEPKRTNLHWSDNDMPLDLDSMPLGSALIKGIRQRAGACTFSTFIHHGSRLLIISDFEAIKNLINVRERELLSIINELLEDLTPAEKSDLRFD